MKKIIQVLKLCFFLTACAGTALTNAEVTYYHADLLGTPTLITDENGNVISRSHSRPFGESIEGVQQDVGYTGHQHDADLGLTYMQARYYDPVIGRFYSNDPIGFRDVHSFNRYSYANNNPYKYIDPDGRDSKNPFADPADNPGCGCTSILDRWASAVTNLINAYSESASDATGESGESAENSTDSDSKVEGILGNKEATGKKGEYVGDINDYDADFEELTGGESKEYDNGTKVGKLPDGSTVETHESSGKGTDGFKGKNVSRGTKTIKIVRPEGKRNLTIRYPEVK